VLALAGESDTDVLPVHDVDNLCACKPAFDVRKLPRFTIGEGESGEPKERKTGGAARGADGEMARGE